MNTQHPYPGAIVSDASALERHHHVPPSTRAGIASELIKYLAELSGLDDSPAAGFSLARFLRSRAERSNPTGRERAVLEGAAVLMGQDYDPARAWIPLNALRSMNTVPGSAGGYLAGVQTLSPVDVLRPWSVVASSGVTMLTGLRESCLLPRVNSETAAVTWVAEPASSPSEASSTLGSVSVVPKTGLAFTKFSIRLLRQAGEGAEAFLRQQLVAAIGEALDSAYFSGPGGASPLGLINTAGIGTQSGTDLAHAGLLAMRQKTITAGARERGLQWVGTPAVQELLGARERSEGGGRFLWDDDGILGKPAHSTANAASAALVVGDFSQAAVAIFGPGVRIDIDPSQDFNAAGLVARVMLMCDVAFPRPEAFTVATSVT